MHRETCPFLVRSASAGRCRNPSYGSVIAYRICCSADLLAPPPENSFLLTSRPLSSRKDNAIRWHGSCCLRLERKVKVNEVLFEGRESCSAYTSITYRMWPSFRLNVELYRAMAFTRCAMPLHCKQTHAPLYSISPGLKR